jgi:hypothetical protein
MPVERVICSVEGCNNLVSLKGYYYGKKYYRTKCEKHRRGDHPSKKKKYGYGHCSLCGWQGHCDKHRIIKGKDGGTYRHGNVVLVCPNCHRALHKLGNFNQKQINKLEQIEISFMENVELDKQQK